MSLVHIFPRYSRSEAKAYARNNLRGVWGAIPYPFTPDDELDEQGLRRNIREAKNLPAARDSSLRSE